jgi:hypothetical protein
MITFDMPSRDVCTMRRIPTNTPLQALVTLNDEAYVECAAGLADRMIAEGGAIVRGSTDPVLRGSSEPVLRGSSEPVERGSRDPVLRGSPSEVVRGSPSEVVRGSSEPVLRGSRSEVVRGSPSEVVRGSPDPAQPPVRGQETRAQQDQETRAQQDQETLAQQRIAWAYRAATGKEPATDTLDDLMRLYEEVRDQPVGDSHQDSSALRGKTRPRAQQSGPTPEQAALAIVASTILNLDEVLTK